MLFFSPLTFSTFEEPESTLLLSSAHQICLLMYTNLNKKKSPLSVTCFERLAMNINDGLCVSVGGKSFVRHWMPHGSMQEVYCLVVIGVRRPNCQEVLYTPGTL